MSNELNIAEIPHENGIVRYRYSRYLSADGKKWIRHGLFRAFHEDGTLASEGTYVDGVEHGLWRDFHANGKPAAEGNYENGQEAAGWKFWNDQGVEISS
ncbi:toxin-antitoxin system YwqK family antitoxin [Bordetella sp. N]|uniref:toxin-antitoxin system YwqK family antitoxin n=1 Tax=Bordetella sp. N TaxID=1746199 RepID=UPI00070FE3CF|nr:hypothetical protein [Bordetella sp. N]ALM85393.1 hypothetical protein ASB57_22625 [Bordetella sp. N]